MELRMIKKIDFSKSRDDSKLVYIAIDLELEKEMELIGILQEFSNVFA